MQIFARACILGVFVSLHSVLLVLNVPVSCMYLQHFTDRFDCIQEFVHSNTSAEISGLYCIVHWALLD